MSTIRTARYTPQPPEIIAALMAAGCGIIRRPKPVEAMAPVEAQSGAVEPVESAPEQIAVEQGPPTLDRILRAVARVTGMSYREIVSERRHIPAVRARHIYYFVAREVTPKSLPAIGRACCNKDHSTVLHGVHKVQNNRQAFEPELSRVLRLFRPIER